MTATSVTPKTSQASETPKTAKSAARVRVRASRLVLYTVLVVITGLMLGPFGWLIITGLKTTPELAASPVHWLPDKIQWHNFADAFTNIDFLGYARNSLIIALIYATLVTLSSAWVGFGFARLNAPGKKTLFRVLLGSMMLPQMITLFPTYLIFAQLGMVNTYWPWVLWGLAAAPYLVFLFRQFFAGMRPGAGGGRDRRRLRLRGDLLADLPAAVLAGPGRELRDRLHLDLGRLHRPHAAPVQRSHHALRRHHDLVHHGGWDAREQSPGHGSVMYVVPILLIFLVAQRGFVAGMSTTGLK